MQFVYYKFNWQSCKWTLWNSTELIQMKGKKKENEINSTDKKEITLRQKFPFFFIYKIKDKHRPKISINNTNQYFIDF